MTMTRREMMLAGLGLVVSGCTAGGTQVSNRPGASWPTTSAPQSPSGQDVAAAPAQAPAGTGSALDPLNAIPRTRWARSGPTAGKVNPMNGVSRITVHHEGWTAVWFTDEKQTASRLEQIRQVHTRDRHWGDVGYHYIIDRSGRVWQARSLAYQGAHVSANNEHNLGIMVLGNFDIQSPSDAQLNALSGSLRTLMHRYKVPLKRVYTHQELMPTACPGKRLQPRMIAMRSNGALV